MNELRDFATIQTMRDRDDILQRAKQLKRSELFRLIGQLDVYLSSSDEKKTLRKGRPLYAGTLALSGAARSAYSDVSTHKGKHLADIYASRRAR